MPKKDTNKPVPMSKHVGKIAGAETDVSLIASANNMAPAVNEYLAMASREYAQERAHNNTGNGALVMAAQAAYTVSGTFSEAVNHWLDKAKHGKAIGNSAIANIAMTSAVEAIAIAGGYGAYMGAKRRFTWSEAISPTQKTSLNRGLRLVIPIIAVAVQVFGWDGKSEPAPFKMNAKGSLVGPVKLVMETEDENTVSYDGETKDKTVTNAARRALKLLGLVDEAKTKGAYDTQASGTPMEDAATFERALNAGMRLAVDKVSGLARNYESIPASVRQSLDQLLRYVASMPGAPIMLKDEEESPAVPAKESKAA